MLMMQLQFILGNDSVYIMLVSMLIISIINILLFIKKCFFKIDMTPNLNCRDKFL